LEFVTAVLGSGLEDDRTLIVSERVMVARDVVALTLRDPAGAKLPSWQPGSHIDLVLPAPSRSPAGSPGAGDAPLVRQFSLCGDPRDATSYRVAILREDSGRGGSVAVHDRLHAGSTVVSRGPRNHFAFEVAPSYRFIAGGIGITAIYPMVRAAAAAGADWSLAYGGRSIAGMAFATQLRDTHPDRVRIYESHGAGRMDVADVLARPDAVTDVYCCGPESLLHAAEVAASELRWLPGALHVERFVARELGDLLWPRPFEVDLLLSGQTITVRPGETILERARDCGGIVLSSCREGTCGTCETPVLEGLIDHRDSVLTADEQAAGDRMMICVSRAACERIVLEL
jgi:ferredoxin-NADP reductase